MGLKEIILDTLFPPLCFGCQQYHKDYFCKNCRQKIKIHTSLFCSVCKRRLADNKKVCHKKDGYRLAAVVDYQNELIQKIIQDLKYNFLTSAMGPIKKIIDEYAVNVFSEKFKSFIIIPIPLSNQRFRERGFNQAELIGQYLSEKLQMPIYQNLILRVKNNSKQSEVKSWKERIKNMKGCFQIVQPELIYGKKIILVDDVFTSGATMNESVSLLRQNGVREVLGFVLARAN